MTPPTWLPLPRPSLGSASIHRIRHCLVAELPAMPLHALGLVRACAAFTSSRPTPLGPAAAARRSRGKQERHLVFATTTRNTFAVTTPPPTFVKTSFQYPCPDIHVKTVCVRHRHRVFTLISSFNIILGIPVPGPPQKHIVHGVWMDDDEIRGQLARLHQRTLNGFPRRVPTTPRIRALERTRRTLRHAVRVRLRLHHLSSSYDTITMRSMKTTCSPLSTRSWGARQHPRGRAVLLSLVSNMVSQVAPARFPPTREEEDRSTSS
ncbi:hypothetical protein B0H14DRAFT_125646 [Mycena olivaceomarginata]|nr:hypothetical protein B0H14DRAFT_125646 [Mycena olivaceomarginata]